jgi:hypothetical protein
MANPNAHRFDALPADVRELCAGFGVHELSRICEPYLALHCARDSGNEPAGEGPGEATTAAHPDDELRATALEVRTQLRRFPDWRRVLAPDFVCPGGFVAPLAGVGAAGPRRWASEEHYVRASMLVTSAGATPEALELARRLSLDSGHPVASLPAAARELVVAGECALTDAHGVLFVFRRAAGLALGPAAYAPEALGAACWRAAEARFTQHPLSRAALLATGRSLLTARTPWAPAALNLSAMAVREGLRGGLPAPRPAGWWPVPAPAHEEPAPVAPVAAPGALLAAGAPGALLVGAPRAAALLAA